MMYVKVHQYGAYVNNGKNHKRECKQCSVPEIVAHTYVGATCGKEGTCVCGVKGGKKDHSYNIKTATCTTAKYCTTCKYVAAKATGHKYNLTNATCITAKKCTICKHVAQNAIGHSYTSSYAKKDATYHYASCARGCNKKITEKHTLKGGKCKCSYTKR